MAKELWNFGIDGNGETQCKPDLVLKRESYLSALATNS